MRTRATLPHSLTDIIASARTDPLYPGDPFVTLPNPDPILRKLGRTQEVFDAIAMDAHMVGELRAIRSGLLSFEWRVQAGGEAPADLQAVALCEAILRRPVGPYGGWADVVWTMAQAVFRGFQVLEVVWEREGHYLVPAKVVDRPQRRFSFTLDHGLRLLTREAPVEGIELGPRKWLVARHMPTWDNPYGVALLSSCFWPYTFKHSGWRYFVKFCERYGLPWPIGKYPPGTPKADQDALADRLAEMVEDSCAVIPGDSTVELMSVSAGMANLPQERLIALANREMSKALTSQTLATEIDGEGSRAASQTHHQREQTVNESDRHIIEELMSALFGWVAELNFPGAKAPRFEFYEEGEARKDWVEVIDEARRFMAIPTAYAYDRLQIPRPKPGEAVLPAGPVGGVMPGALPRPQAQFSQGCPVAPRPRPARPRPRADEGEVYVYDYRYKVTRTGETGR